MCANPNSAIPHSHAPHHHVVGNIKPAHTLHGVWRKDYRHSDLDSMQQALDEMKLSRMVKAAAMKMVNGLKVEMDPAQESATVHFLATVPFYKVTEEYRRGHETRMGRRDLRRGEQRAVALALQPDMMHVELAWDGELPGKVHETFVMNAQGQLVVRGIMEVNGRKIDVKTVYNRER